ncbi:unnamed protein product [Urochloa decumbens]|uniref:RING-type E3 ubiquitin transferase n=1 Tax=Urochloa decumbens TaxID=240449 RepID=A0ABC8WIV2_9POAL
MPPQLEEEDVSDDDVPLFMARSKRAKQMKVKKISSGGAGPNKDNGSSAPAMPQSAPAASARPESAAGPGVVAVEDTDALNCGICFVPLKPPIFQCNAGHVVCSPCRDKIKATGKCHVCGVATGGYGRCHVMERLVESIRVQCPNAAYGCIVRPAYYNQHDHSQTCAHAPCHCPSKVCGFIGSMAALLDHCSSVHFWPCFEGKVSEGFSLCLRDDYYASNECVNVIHLHDGFNFLHANHTIDGQSSTAAPVSSERGASAICPCHLSDLHPSSRWQWRLQSVMQGNETGALVPGVREQPPLQW